MHRTLLSAVLSLSVLLSTLVAAQGASYTFTTIDVPGSGATQVFGINASGESVGYYIANGLHGFTQSGGLYTTIDVPGQAFTEPYGVNTAGVIVGFYADVNNFTHGFLLSGGNLTTIDVPDSISTWAYGMNDQGQIVGAYQDAQGLHGFVLTAGQFTTIDIPGSFQVLATGINNIGHIVGIYGDAQGTLHGFLLVDGLVTTINVPGSAPTEIWGINDAGVIAGIFMPAGGNMHGFILMDGHFMTIDVPGADITTVYDINNQGQLVGGYQDAMTGLNHGFLATPVIVDTTPPVITVAASPATLWPPNGKLVPVTVSGMITDESGVQASAYQVMDEYGQIQPSGSVTLARDGRYTFTVALQASRRGTDQDGRQYLIAVSATDKAGNRGVKSATVTVPHN
jgi:hypothetical protein